jgi:hypothetical protein
VNAGAEKSNPRRMEIANQFGLEFLPPTGA